MCGRVESGDSFGEVMDSGDCSGLLESSEGVDEAIAGGGGCAAMVSMARLCLTCGSGRRGGDGRGTRDELRLKVVRRGWSSVERRGFGGEGECERGSQDRKSEAEV